MTGKSCGHDDAPCSIYTGLLCSPCYREIELRVPGLADYCHTLRRMAAPSTVSAVKLEERVQESGGQRLIIDDRLIGLADDLYYAATDVVLSTAELLHTDRPYALEGVTKPQRYSDTTATGFAAMSVERWISRNLRWIAELDDCWSLLEPLLDALTDARRAVDPSPPRKPALRGICRVCGGRVTIEVRSRGVFHSACGGCGETGQIHATVVERVLSEDNDGDGRGQGDGPNGSDAMELSGGGTAAGEPSGPQRAGVGA